MLYTVADESIQTHVKTTNMINTVNPDYHNNIHIVYFQYSTNVISDAYVLTYIVNIFHTIVYIYENLLY